MSRKLINIDDSLPPLIQQLLLDGKITREQYESSALSQVLILNLIRDEKITVENALALSLQKYRSSALSNKEIYLLVMHERITVDDALMLSIEEVEDTVHCLKEKENKTPQQKLRLDLHETYSTISIYDVELIVSLAFKLRRSRMEERELALLLDPSSRPYACKIVMLECNDDRSPVEDRRLALLLNSDARPYAEVIARLEFKVERTEEDNSKLEMVYLKTCCRIPEETPDMVFLRQLAQHGRDKVNEESSSIYHSCGMELASGVPRSSVLFPLSHQPALSFARNIFIAAAKKVVSIYVESVPYSLKKTDAFQNYILVKIDLLFIGLLRYFVDASTPRYSAESLNALVLFLEGAISNKKFSLNEEAKIMNLALFIERYEESAISGRTLC